eukprot:202149-Amphidinium_carterae.1
MQVEEEGTGEKTVAHPQVLPRPRRGKVHVGQIAKGWYLDWSDWMVQTQGWDYCQCLAIAKTWLPSVFATHGSHA